MEERSNGRSNSRSDCPSRPRSVFFDLTFRFTRLRRDLHLNVRWLISRVLYPANGVMAIHLGRPLPNASCDLPERPAQQTGLSGEPNARSYMVLLPVGFTLPPPLPMARCALTAPFHPYPLKAGGLLSVALSLGSPPPGVTRHRVYVEPGLSSPKPDKPIAERPPSHLTPLFRMPQWELRQRRVFPQKGQSS